MLLYRLTLLGNSAEAQGVVISYRAIERMLGNVAVLTAL